MNKETEIQELLKAESAKDQIKQFNESKNLNTVTELITPETAKTLLENNNPNYRSMRQGKANEYAQEMLEGRWRILEDIAIDTNGNVINGQHRLQAVVSAGFPVAFRVTRGYHPDCIHYFDTSALKRSGKDALSYASSKNNIKDIYGKHVNILSFAIKSIHGGCNYKNSLHISPAQIISLAPRYEDAVLFIKEVFLNDLKDSNGIKIKELTKPLKKAGYYGAVGRCYLFYKNDVNKINKLREICDILRRQAWGRESCEYSETLQRLYNKVSTLSGGGDQTKKAYDWTAYILDSILKGKCPKRVEQLECEPFPLSLN